MKVNRKRSAKNTVDSSPKEISNPLAAFTKIVSGQSTALCFNSLRTGEEEDYEASKAEKQRGEFRSHVPSAAHVSEKRERRFGLGHVGWPPRALLVNAQAEEAGLDSRPTGR